VRYLIGIDEAGRGPLAGPVAVGAVLVPVDFDWKLVEGVRDSKKLSEKKREEIFVRAGELEKSHSLRYAVSTSSAAYIDRYGIVPAIKRALAEALFKVTVTEDGPLHAKDGPRYEILLDGGLHAPSQFSTQKTIIRGDDTEPIISLASIMAKVTRDRLMKRLSPKYPEYDFHVHKGYGTAAHRKLIVGHGLCELHRTTFCSRILLEAGS